MICFIKHAIVFHKIFKNHQIFNIFSCLGIIKMTASKLSFCDSPFLLFTL